MYETRRKIEVEKGRGSKNSGKEGMRAQVGRAMSAKQKSSADLLIEGGQGGVGWDEQSVVFRMGQR